MAYAYYNENDPFAAEWLRQLIKDEVVSPGYVDERSIEDVKPQELEEYTRHHFFAGIGVWDYALNQASYPTGVPVWTGSCPCQPFSAAGQRKGFADERHLWPMWFWLIRQCRPVTLIGEQVAGKNGEAWLDAVSSDLEGEGYTVGTVVAPACGFGAPHMRKRLYWVAHNQESRQRSGSRLCNRGTPEEWREVPADDCGTVQLADAMHRRQQDGEEESRSSRKVVQRPEKRSIPADDCCNSKLADPDGWYSIPEGQQHGQEQRLLPESAGPVRRECSPVGDGQVRLARMGQGERPSPTNGFWEAVDWLYCRDGKWRPVEPGSKPLAHGASNRVGRLRGYGNAIVAPQAQAVIEAFLHSL